MFRLHLDILLTADNTNSTNVSQKFVEFLMKNKTELVDMGIPLINYRLGNDEDRQKSNHLIKNENGHVANKKSHIHLTDRDSVVE